MAQNNYTILGNDVKVGIAGERLPWGLVLSADGDKSGSLDEYPGESGETETLIPWNHRESLSLEVLRGGLKGVTVDSLPEPEFGDIVEFRGKKWIINKVQPKEELGKATKHAIGLLHLPELVIPDPSSPASSEDSESPPAEDSEFPPAE